MTLSSSVRVESITQGIDFGVLAVGFAGEATSINSRRASRNGNRRNDLINRNEALERVGKRHLIANGARQANGKTGHPGI
jgi:hypothetical protein